MDVHSIANFYSLNHFLNFTLVVLLASENSISLSFIGQQIYVKIVGFLGVVFKTFTRLQL